MAINQVNNNTKFTEWKDITNAIIVALGDNSALNTTEKTSLVLAINEILGILGDITTLDTTQKDDIVIAINEVLSNVGDISNLDSSFQTIDNTVSALNNVIGRIGTLTNLNTTNKTNIVNALNEANTKAGGVGTLSNLNTTEKSNLVAALNEVLGQLGDITTLDTTYKDDIVGALNEVRSTQAAIVNIPVTNMVENHGRFSTETTRVLTTFDPTALQLDPYNSAAIIAGERFLDDNADNGGSGGALGPDMLALTTELVNAGRTDARNGFEFYIADVTAGGGTSDPETYNANDYYPIFTGSDAFLGAIGSTVTFQCWVRAKTVADEPTYGGIVIGDAGGLVTSYVNGVEATQQSILAVADGWVHLRQEVILTNEFKKFFPAIFANNADVVQVALPAIFNAKVEGIHLGVI